MRRVLELIFRHWTRLVGILVIPVVIALAIVWVQPRQYEGTATLWALQRYAVIGATGSEADLNSTPATTQVTALDELLQTHTFELAVAKETNLVSTFNAATRADPNKLTLAIEQEISTKVIPTAVGYNLYQITYDNKNAQVAKQVVAAVVDQFGASASSFSVAEAKQLIQAYQSQLVQAEKNANTTTQIAADYAVAHPTSTAQNDPTYSQLLQQAQGAQATAGAIQNQITQLSQQLATIGNGSSALYSIVDAPTVDTQPVSRSKSLMLGGGIGLAIGLLAITLLIVALLRRDRSVYSPDDLRRFTNLPVAIELPELPASVIAAFTQARPVLSTRVEFQR